MENFNGVIGYEHIKAELDRIIDCINNKEKYEALGVKIPHNLLLHGEPGLGKSLMANKFVEALHRNKYIIRKDKPDGDFVHSINDIMKDAIANQPSVVLLDDLDKFSNNDDNHRNSDEFIVVQSFIDDVKDKDVYIVATANELNDMPESLIRAGRFDAKIEFNRPSVQDSALIIEHYLKNKKVTSDVDCMEIAKILDGGSCAVLESVMNEAGLFAGYNNKELIDMDDIVRASLRVIFDSPEDIRDKTPYQIKLAAYHEAGHALTAELLEPGSVNLISISNYFGPRGGVTSTTLNDDYFASTEMMENRIRVLVAGAAATAIVFATNDTGSRNDFNRANRIAHRFFDGYNFYGVKVGSYEESEQEKVTREVRLDTALAIYYNEVKNLLIKNRDKLDKLAMELMEKKNLIQRDIKKIMEC